MYQTFKDSVLNLYKIILQDYATTLGEKHTI